MRKSTRLIISTICILTIICLFFCNITLAASTINPDDYNPGGLTQADTKVAFAKTGMILGAVRNISIVVSVITLMIIGLKYIFGSIEEKANYKASMIPYIIGCIMAVCGTTLVSFIYNALN